MSLTVVMPSYNEENIIEKVVRSFYDEISAKIDDLEFLVIDSSLDNSLSILNALKKDLPKLKVIHTPPLGHGKALLQGYKLAQKDYVFQTDSDGQFSPKDFWKLYDIKEKSGFILGYRKKRKDPASRLVLTKVIQFVNLIAFGTKIRDINCPFRLMKRELLQNLLKKIDEDSMAPNILLTLQAKKDGVNVIEVPVTHFERKTGESVSGMRFFKLVSLGLAQLIKWRFSKK
ncbi:MAG TPA: glycosyltransferase family 2 protein [Elusimicrobiales bacterium]|nr:glycosyltransferase family 2 protein [Elusimicrobiales bacterium]